MEARELIEKLRLAKQAHIGWVNRAHALIEGKPVDKEKIPITPGNCTFGKWYYGEGRKLAELETYKEVEQPHIRLHAIYEDIFNLLFTEQKGSFLSRLIGRHDKERQEKLALAHEHFRDLQRMSDIIIHKLDALERDVRVLYSPENRNRWDQTIIKLNRAG